MGLIDWCDEKISELKINHINFVNGIPRIPTGMLYDKVPKYMETYQFRNEISLEDRKYSLICFYSDENRLWQRLNKIEKDSEIFKNYGGIVGMDISPSVNMLSPRQYQSILINSIYNCLIALKGIKVAINARVGDLGTYYLIKDIQPNKTIVFGNLGCKGKFRFYSYFQFIYWLKYNKPKHICLYGTISKNDIKFLKKLMVNIKINLFHCHNHCSLEHKKSVFIISGNKYTINNPREGYVRKYILSHKINEFKLNKKLISEEDKIYGC